MTTTTYRSTLFPRAALGPVRAEIERMLTRIKGARARRAVYRRTIAELSSLSGRELADIGIHRSQIRRIAIETASEEAPHA